MSNTTPGITGPTRRGADRFRGYPHPYAPHVILLWSFHDRLLASSTRLTRSRPNPPPSPSSRSARI